MFGRAATAVVIARSICPSDPPRLPIAAASHSSANRENYIAPPSVLVNWNASCSECSIPAHTYNSAPQNR